MGTPSRARQPPAAFPECWSARPAKAQQNPLLLPLRGLLTRPFLLGAAPPATTTSRRQGCAVSLVATSPARRDWDPRTQPQFTLSPQASLAGLQLPTAADSRTSPTDVHAHSPPPHSRRPAGSRTSSAATASLQAEDQSSAPGLRSLRKLSEPNAPVRGLARDSANPTFPGKGGTKCCAPRARPAALAGGESEIREAGPVSSAGLWLLRQWTVIAYLPRARR